MRRGSWDRGPPALLAAGHSVTAIVRQPLPWRLANVEDAALAVSPVDEWASEIEQAKPEVFVSLDWDGVAGQSRNDDRQWSNLPRQRELILAAVRSGATRIVGVGSQAEYGPRSDRISERAPTTPVSVYGQSKVAAMSQLMELCEGAGITAVWARVFSVYGPMDNDGVLLQEVTDALRERGSVDLSSGEQLWSYLYASDAGRAMATLVGDPLAEGIYNVGHPAAPRLRNTVEQFALLGGLAGGLRFGALPGNSLSSARLQPDVDRLRSLGWDPEISLATGLELTAAWLAGGSVVDPFRADRRLPRRMS